ncbi:MAG: nicotinate-nucleotide adenylyltransferase [Gemmatimonadaceae bacterium]|nr:nicotinate-nucleotide adenylyltransferase [Gemmatimonadaceae bacterium]
MKVGLFGGSFDPPHLGHWLVAVDALERLGLDRVDFVPTARQPLKAQGHVASDRDRLAMVGAMVAGDARFGVNASEVERGGLSFTVDTVSAHRAAHPDDDLHLLVGADAVASLDRWREPARLLAQVRLVVLERDGRPAPATGWPPGAIALASRRVDISSTEVRARVRDGLSLRGFVADAVAAHIAHHALYR